MRRPVSVRWRLYSVQTVRKFVIGLLVINILLALLNSFLARAGWALAEWEAGRRLSRALGPAARYDVRLFGSWSDLLSGDVPAQIIRADEVHLHDGLVVSSLEVRIEGLRISSDEITRLDGVAYRATVTEDALNAYLPVRPHRSRFEPTVRLTITPHHLQVGGDMNVFGVRVPLQAEGRLEVRDGTQLWVVLDSARVALLKLRGPQKPIEFVLYDLSVLPFGLRLQEFRLLDGRIEVAGTASPPLPLSLRALEHTPSPSP